MARLRHAVFRAVRLTQQLLALGRAQGDPSALRHGSVDLAALVSECAGEWVHRGIEADVDVGFELEPAWSIGDRDLLVEMIENLVDNAFAHARPRAPIADAGVVAEAAAAPVAPRSITVTTRNDGAWTRVMVDDSGDGIPEADRQRVFERFVTLRDRVGPASASGASKGSGLGLAIVRTIAEQHGGDVAVSRSPAGGARFTISLPAAPRGTQVDPLA